MVETVRALGLHLRSATTGSNAAPSTPLVLLNHSSCVRLFVTPWTEARQPPLSMGVSSAGRYFTTEPTGKPGQT